MNFGLFSNHRRTQFVSDVRALPAVTGPWGVTVAHGLNLPNLQARWALVNLKADLGFSPGDELDALSGFMSGGGVNPSAWVNSRETGLAIDGRTWQVCAKTSPFTLTTLTAAANWGLKVYVWQQNNN